MAAKGYTSKTQVENYLLIDIDASFDTQVSEWIEQVENHIDRLTGRNFIAVPEASEGDEQVFDGNGKTEMIIPDAVEISSIEIDGSAVTTGEWYEYPANETPKNRIKLKYDSFTAGNQNVAITATWGYSTAVPADITFAATVLVAGIVNASYNGEGEISQVTIGRYTVAYGNKKQMDDFKRAQAILELYTKYTF